MFDWEQNAFLGYMVEQYENERNKNDNEENEDENRDEYNPFYN